MMRTKSIYAMTLLFITAMISGCFEFEERIHLNGDNSGSMEIEYWTLKDVHVDDDSFDLPEKEEDIRKEVEEKYTSDKVTLKEFHVKYDERSRQVRFKVAFDNVLDLNGIDQFHKNRIEFNRSGKSIRFFRSIDLDDLDINEENDTDNFIGRIVMNLLEEGFSKVKFRFEVESPFAIKTSNADFTPGDKRAVWKFRLSDVMYDRKVDMNFQTDK